MKTSTLLLITILPIELMTLLLFFLPERYISTGAMMTVLYFGVILLVLGKYIKIEKYSKDSKIVGNICLGVGSICFLIVIVYFIVINI